MKILVTVKRVVDYNVKVHALADHTGPDTAAAKMSMNPFDEIAVEQAVRFKEAGVADEVVAVSIGGAKTVDTLRVAMAMGADRAIHVTTDAVIDPAVAAEILAAVCRRENPDLVLMGKQAIDDGRRRPRRTSPSCEGGGIARQASTSCSAFHASVRAKKPASSAALLKPSFPIACAR